MVGLVVGRALAAALVLVGLVPIVGADPVAPGVVCTPAQAEARVLVAPLTFAPGLVAPGLSLDPCIRNNGRLLMVAADPVLTHEPVTTLDAGACFDLVRDLGRPLIVGETIPLAVHVHDPILAYVTVAGGVSHDCSAARVASDAQFAIIPYHCRNHPDTMQANLLIRAF